MTAILHTDMPARDYHADPAPEPSLSSSIARIITEQSPLHAWAAHPRLGRRRGEPEESKRPQQIGSVAHKLALGRGAEVAVIPARDYRTKAAQEAKAAALSAGIIPILESDYAEAETIAGPLSEALCEYLGASMADCLTEAVIIWQEPGGIWCRVMIDAMRKDYRRMCDLKTTAASASPEACAKRVYEGYEVQDALYLRAGDALDPDGAGHRRFGFIFAEQSSPHAISPPVELSEGGLEIGRRRLARAMRIWGECTASGQWPGYGTDVYVAQPPAWRAMEEEHG